MVNCSIGKSPFTIVYSKPFDQPTNLVKLSSGPIELVKSIAERVTSTLAKVKQKLCESNAHYQAIVDKHRRLQVFQEGELVMVHLRKSKFPTGKYHKLQLKWFGPFHVKHNINDNVYVLDLPSDWKISFTFNVVDLSIYHPLDGVSLVNSSSSQALSKKGRLMQSNLFKRRPATKTRPH